MSQLYNYSRLNKDELITILQGNQKIIEKYLNRAEELDKFLNKNMDKPLTGLQLLKEINRLDNDQPIVLGKE